MRSKDDAAETPNSGAAAGAGGTSAAAEGDATAAGSCGTSAPSARGMLAALSAAGKSGGNGRSVFAETEIRAWRERIAGNPAYRPMLDALCAEGGRLLREPMPKLTWTMYRRFRLDGDRAEYESSYFDRRKRLAAFGLLSWLEPERTDYRDAMLDAVWAICGEISWCLPAHYWPFCPEEETPSLSPGERHGRVDTALELSERNGEVGAALELPERIDLFAAETAFALSELLRLTGGGWPGAVRRLVHTEIGRRIFVPYTRRDREPFHWENARNNWSAVCAGSIGAAAIHLLGDDAELAELLEKVLPTLDCFLDGYGEDGACPEGYHYWTYGFGFYVMFADLLRRRTSGRLDLLSSDKVRRMALFQEKCFLSGGSVVNFSDSPAEAAVPLGLSHELHRRFPETAVPDRALGSALVYDKCGRWAPALRNLIWYDPGLAGGPWGDAACFLPDAGWLVSRKGEGRFCFAAKGGHNGESHNQNDVGHFILHGGGETFLADLGSGRYSRQYFGPERYSFLCNGSQGHSVPIVNGQYQQEGPARRAAVIHAAAATEAGTDMLELELSAAYGIDSMSGLARRWEWHKNGARPRLTLEDRFTFREPPESLAERLLCGFRPDIEAAGAGRVTMTGSSGLRLALSFDGCGVRAAAEPVEFVGHDGACRTFWLLDLNWQPPLRDREYRMRIDFRFESATEAERGQQPDSAAGP